MISSSPLTPSRNSLKFSLTEESVFMYYLCNSKLILKMYFVCVCELPVGDFVLPTLKICRGGESPCYPMRSNDAKGN